MRSGSTQARDALLQRAAIFAGGTLVCEDFASRNTAPKWAVFKARCKYILRQIGIIE